MKQERINSTAMPMDFGLRPVRVSTSRISGSPFPCMISLDAGAANVMLCTSTEAVNELIANLKELVDSVDQKSPDREDAA